MLSRETLCGIRRGPGARLFAFGYGWSDVTIGQNDSSLIHTWWRLRSTRVLFVLLLFLLLFLLFLLAWSLLLLLFLFLLLLVQLLPRGALCLFHRTRRYSVVVVVVVVTSTIRRSSSSSSSGSRNFLHLLRGNFRIRSFARFLGRVSRNDAIRDNLSHL